MTTRTGVIGRAADQSPAPGRSVAGAATRRLAATLRLVGPERPD